MTSTTRVVQRAYRVALDPTLAQRRALERHAGAARAAYNARLADLVGDHKRYSRDLAAATYEPELDHLVPAADLAGLGLETARKRQLAAAKRLVQSRAVSPAMVAYRQELAWLTYTEYAHMKPLGALQQAAKRMKRQHGPAPTSPYKTPAGASMDTFAAVNAWSSEVNRYALSNGMAGADRAFTNWRASRSGARKGRAIGYPRFHRKGRGLDSFTLNHDVRRPSLRPDGYRRFVLPEKITGTRGGSIRLHGNVRQLARRIAKGRAQIQSVTISRGGRHWHLSILVTEEITIPTAPTRRQRAAGPVGVDVGVRSLAALSTGEIVTNPRHLRRARRRLERAQRHLSRTKWIRESDGALVATTDRRRGVRHQPSSGRLKAAARVARLHADVAAARAGTIHQLTKRLATGHDLVAIEDLNVGGMTRSAKGTLDEPGRNVRAKAGLNRGILDAGFAELRRQLTYKTTWYGSDLVVIDRYAPTSKTCSTCGAVKPTLPLAEREYHCTTCGTTMDRDVNAARNIAAAGMRHDASGEGSRKTPAEDAPTTGQPGRRTPSDAGRPGPSGTGHPDPGTGRSSPQTDAA